MSHARPRIRNISEWHRAKRTHACGTLVQSQIIRHVGFGALCLINGKFPAVLRRREVSWDPDLQSMGLLPEGTSFDAIVIQHDDDWREFVLSIKAAKPKPFENFTSSHEVGQIVEATVTQLTPRVAIVRLEGGVEAEVPFDSLPHYKMQHPEMTARWELVEGDMLLLVIDEIRQIEKKIVLNFRKAIEQKKKEWEEWLGNVRSARVDVSGISSFRTYLPDFSNEKVSPAKPVGRLYILVVDNEKDIAVPLSSILTDRTHHVDIATSCTFATTKIRELKQLDVAIIDLQLAGESGIQLISQIGKRFPEARIIVYTGNLQAIKEASFPQTVIPLLKPMDTEGLIEVLEGRHVPATPTRGWEIDEQVAQFAHDGSGTMDALGLGTLRVIDDYLASIIEPLDKVGLAILSQSHATGDISCLRDIGLPRELFGRSSRHLKYSFIGNVLGGRNSGFHYCRKVEQTSDSCDAFDILLNESRYDATYAVPLEVEMNGTSIAVFVFFERRSGDLSLDAVRHLHHQVAALSLSLTRAIWDAELARHQRALSAGGFMLGMAHELRNSISAMKLNVYSTLTARRSTISEDERNQTTSENLKSLQIQLDQLSKSMESLLGLSRTSSTGYKPAGNLIADVVDQCKSIAEGAEITIVVDNDASLDVCSTHIPLSVFQVIVNVVLNSIQHVRAYRKQDGFIRITLSESKIGSQTAIEVCVTDNAFGINWRQKEQLFNMFHTTRREGSGLGLHVSRMIAESLGGDIKFLSSYKFIGTTVRIRIPVTEMEK